MSEVNVHQAKTHLSKLLARVESGEEIVITKAGRPVAKLVPLTVAKGPRVPGECRGQVWIADDFDAPLPPEILEAFES
ncbi:MAG TPA: type II toxin-antitoxin system Phd/YefM family antitoxin [Myxococcaceae bacterium]|nr:type II toxin-antitoxin system Phd/YefM family antitoxin [Myxococcaceae bacterium]